MNDTTKILMAVAIGVVALFALAKSGNRSVKVGDITSNYSADPIGDWGRFLASILGEPAGSNTSWEPMGGAGTESALGRYDKAVALGGWFDRATNQWMVPVVKP